MILDGMQQESSREQQKWQELAPLERSILSLEKENWKYPGAIEAAVRRRLGLTPIAYYQQLNTMIDNPRIIALEPALTRRLREHRDG